MPVVRRWVPVAILRPLLDWPRTRVSESSRPPLGSPCPPRLCVVHVCRERVLLDQTAPLPPPTSSLTSPDKHLVKDGVRQLQ